MWKTLCKVQRNTGCQFLSIGAANADLLFFPISLSCIIGMGWLKENLKNLKGDKNKENLSPCLNSSSQSFLVRAYWPCLQNTCPVQPSIVCSHAQNCHSWLFSLAFPALSNIIKFFFRQFSEKDKNLFSPGVQGHDHWLSVCSHKEEPAVFDAIFLTPNKWNKNNIII